MKCYNIIKYIEDWAPKETAWQKDNTGLQAGDPGREVKNILLCLDASTAVVDEAIKHGCNLIISHHPLIFAPLKRLDLSKDRKAKIIEKLIKNDIVLYTAHTNLDFTKEGVSFKLAKQLNLNQIKFLTNLTSNQFKLTIFVPSDHSDSVSKAVFEAGGGIIGEYTNCSFRTAGTGTFIGSEKSNPSIGEKNVLESVDEIKLEIIVDQWKLNGVLDAVNKVHPYEEIAYDLIPLNNPNVNYGTGAIGILNEELEQEEFLKHVSDLLGAENLRYSGFKKKIKKVAVCGGSGSDYIKDALKSGADAYITGDLKYHTFQEFEDDILLIDAGHYETEIHVLDEIKARLDNLTEDDREIKVLKYNGLTNPIIFYNNKE